MTMYDNDDSTIQAADGKSYVVSSGSGRKLGKVDRGREACNECRRHKIRCHPHPDDPQHLFPCSRCERMHLSCEFAKHNRGRKRKRPIPLLAPTRLTSGQDGTHQAHLLQQSEAGPSRSHGHGLPAAPSTSASSNLRTLGDPRFPFISTDPEAHLLSPTNSTSVSRHRHSEQGYQHAQQISLRKMVMVGEELSDEEQDEEEEDELESGSEHETGQERRDGRHDADIGRRADHYGHDHRHTQTAVPPHKKKAKMPLRGPELVDDPVKAGYVDEHEGRWLYHLYMTHFNTALPMLDPSIHTYDYVRESSGFLFTAILCVTSRYLSSLTPSSDSAHHISPESAQSVHQQILVLARDHLTWAFAEAIVNVDVVRAMVTLAMHKEPDDDKAGYHIDRAVLMGKELNLGRVPSREEMDKLNDEDKKCLRSRQRVWLCLFFVNSIFNMQFRLPMLILQSDPLVATAHHWLKRSRPDTLIRDTQLVCSIELRRKFLHYRDLLVGPAQDEPVPRSALSLSILTRTMNQDWDVSCEAWIRDIIDAGGTSSHINKPRVWTSSLRLNLNLLIVNQTLRLPLSERIDGGAPSSIAAFHHCLNAATTVLLRLEALDRTQLTFAPDTFLHFALYAATLLSSLSRGQHPHNFEPADIEHCRHLILKTADALDAASAYPSDSPILHAYYLRRLVQVLPAQTQPQAGSHTQVQSAPPAAPPSSSPSPTMAMSTAAAMPFPAIDPALQNVPAPVPTMQGPMNGMGMGSNGDMNLNMDIGMNMGMGTGTLGVELDMLFADFPWVGFENNGGAPGWGGMGPGTTGGSMAQPFTPNHNSSQIPMDIPYNMGMGGNMNNGMGLGVGMGMGNPNGMGHPGPDHTYGHRYGQGQGQGQVQGQGQGQAHMSGMSSMDFGSAM